MVELSGVDCICSLTQKITWCFRPSDIKETSDRWGQPFVTDAQDFFIVGKDSYPWSEIPDFVVGRVGYDNWLVGITFSFRFRRLLELLIISNFTKNYFCDCWLILCYSAVQSFITKLDDLICAAKNVNAVQTLENF